MKIFFYHGGSVMWLLLLLLIVIVILTIKTAISIIVKKRSNIQVETGLNSIIFWGAISAGLGIFGHFAGIFIAMQDILKKGDTSPAIIAEGYFLSITNIFTGLLIFLVASILWIVLRWRYKKLLLLIE